MNVDYEDTYGMPVEVYEDIWDAYQEYLREMEEDYN